MIQVRQGCEVLVVGAGVTGIAAAVSAARQGAHTILVEKNSFPGGTAVIGLHRFICGLYVNGIAMPEDTLNEGIVREICYKLKHLSPRKKAMRLGKVFVLPYSTENLSSVFHSLTRGESHLEVLYNTQAASVKTEQGAITVVTVVDLEKEYDIIPRVVIDCSGEGIIVQLSGARHQVSPPHQRQLAGHTFRVKGLRKVKDLIELQVPYCLAQAVSEKKMPFYLKFTTFTPGDDEDEGYCKLSIPPVGEQDRKEQARNDAVLAHHYLSQTLPAFRDSYITEVSKEVINREGPRVYGKYMLSADDVMSARKFSDGVVKSAWPIELWDQEKER